MKPIRIYASPWHVAHNWSACAIPNTEWGFQQNAIRKWNLGARPWPKNAHWVPYFTPSDYDVVILNVDQQCIDPMLGKAKLYRALNAVTKGVPRVVINHGTPFWPERWEESGRNHWKLPLTLDAQNIAEVAAYQINFLIHGGSVMQNNREVAIEGMKALIGTTPMVTNSQQGAKQWGWGVPIWHGLDSAEWWDLPKEPRAITTISPAGLDAYYGRDLLLRTQELLRDFYGLRLIHVGNNQDWTIDQHPKLEEIGGFGAYRDFLGRSLLYVNLTQESPMPRARSEAMLSGACVLTTPYQDADKFINFNTKPLWEASESIVGYIRAVDDLLDEDGINGLIIPDAPKAVAALINHMINERYATSLKIGAEGKKTAQTIFSLDRYTTEWRSLLETTIGTTP